MNSGVCFFVVLLAMARKGVNGQDGPCESAQSLHSLVSRVAGHQLGKGDQPVSDYYIDDDWYSMASYVIATTNVSCGTTYPWHMEGKLPKGNTEEELTVCNSDCTERKTTKVRRCDDGNYVFYLLALDSNSDAYCIESTRTGGDKTGLEAPEIHFKPVISTEVRKTGQKNENNLHFYCDFIPLDRNLFYTIEWMRTSGFTIVKLLHKVEGSKYDSKLQLKTALHEGHLKARGIDQLPFTVMCSVTAQKDIAGEYSDAKTSEPKFCGIKILTPDIFHIKDNDEVTIELQLTVPFGCHGNEKSCPLNVDVFVPSTTCELPQVGIIKSVRKQCGVTIQRDKYDDKHTFTVKGIAGDRNGVTDALKYQIRFRTVKYQDHPLFANYLLKGATIMLRMDNTPLNGKSCYSHNDPHMKTFEGQTYENQAPGKYVLYKHKTYEVEVQIHTKRWTNTISLNCGIAIRAGRDVFVYSFCNNNRPEIEFRYCEDAVLHHKVRYVDKTYKVYLPTGAVVEIKTYMAYGGHAVNFDVIPSIEDIGSTTGLCGTIDSTREKPDPSKHRRKLKLPMTSMKSEQLQKFRIGVSGAADLFDRKNYDKLKSWSERSYVCTCKDMEYIPGIEHMTSAMCTADSKKTCHDDRSTVSKTDHVCEKARRKRDANDEVHFVEKRSLHSSNYDDIHTTSEISFMRTKPYSTHELNGYFEHGISKREVYDEETAKSGCMSILNTTAFQKCSNLPDLDVSSSVSNCIADAMLTNSMEWSASHLEAIKDQCIHHITVNQPLSPEARSELAEATITENDNGTSLNNSDIDHRTTQATVSKPVVHSSVFTGDFLQEIKDMSCPSECSGHGECVKGKCICDPSYMDIDCSVDVNKAPEMTGIPDLGMCDRTVRPCRQTSVFGEHIVESASLKCKLVPFTVNPQSEMAFSSSTEVPAEVISLFEVRCPLRDSERRRREVSTYTSDGDIATGYKISISNNGQTYSDEDILVVFDSRCVNCSKNAGKVICRQKPGYCVQKGECFSFGEQRECNLCGGDDVNNLHWIPQIDCGDPLEDEPKQLWIIAAVICPVVLLALLITVVMYCKTGRKGKGGSKVDLQEPDTTTRRHV